MCHHFTASSNHSRLESTSGIRVTAVGAFLSRVTDRLCALTQQEEEVTVRFSPHLYSPPPTLSLSLPPHHAVSPFRVCIRLRLCLCAPCFVCRQTETHPASCAHGLRDCKCHRQLENEQIYKRYISTYIGTLWVCTAYSVLCGGGMCATSRLLLCTVVQYGPKWGRFPK